MTLKLAKSKEKIELMFAIQPKQVTAKLSPGNADMI